MNAQKTFHFVLIAAVLAAMACAVAPVRAADARALALKQVPDMENSPKDYDDMVATIERVSGLKVKAAEFKEYRIGLSFVDDVLKPQ